MIKKSKKQKIKYEFFIFAGDTVNPKQYNLKVENPAEVRFLYTSTIATGICIINQVYTLQTYRETNLGVASFPFELILKNNLDEIDTTIYQILITPNTEVRIICKYYVNE